MGKRDWARRMQLIKIRNLGGATSAGIKHIPVCSGHACPQAAEGARESANKDKRFGYVVFDCDGVLVDTGVRVGVCNAPRSLHAGEYMAG